MFGIVCKKAKNEEKKTYLMLVNCGYGFQQFEDEAHEYAIYENKFTGKLIRFCIADATFEPIG